MVAATEADGSCEQHFSFPSLAFGLFHGNFLRHGSGGPLSNPAWHGEYPGIGEDAYTASTHGMSSRAFTGDIWSFFLTNIFQFS